MDAPETPKGSGCSPKTFSLEEPVLGSCLSELWEEGGVHRAAFPSNAKQWVLPHATKLVSTLQKMHEKTRSTGALESIPLFGPHWGIWKEADAFQEMPLMNDDGAPLN